MNLAKGFSSGFVYFDATWVAMTTGQKPIDCQPFTISYSLTVQWNRKLEGDP